MDPTLETLIDVVTRLQKQQTKLMAMALDARASSEAMVQFVNAALIWSAENERPFQRDDWPIIVSAYVKAKRTRLEDLLLEVETGSPGLAAQFSEILEGLARPDFERELEADGGPFDPEGLR